MERIEKIKAITEQVIGMYENNVLQENGSEGFLGWIEDGDAFANLGYTEEETEELLAFAKEVAPTIDTLTFSYLHTEEI